MLPTLFQAVMRRQALSWSRGNEPHSLTGQALRGIPTAEVATAEATNQLEGLPSHFQTEHPFPLLPIPL